MSLAMRSLALAVLAGGSAASMPPTAAMPAFFLCADERAGLQHGQRVGRSIIVVHRQSCPCEPRTEWLFVPRVDVTDLVPVRARGN